MIIIPKYPSNYNNVVEFIRKDLSLVTGHHIIGDYEFRTNGIILWFIKRVRGLIVDVCIVSPRDMTEKCIEDIKDFVNSQTTFSIDGSTKICVNPPTDEHKVKNFGNILDPDNVDFLGGII